MVSIKKAELYMTDKNNIPSTPQLRRRNTPQKQLVFNTLVKLGSHVSAGEIYKEIARTTPEFSRATVFRVLSDMADDGILLRVFTTGGDCKYDVTTYPHYHVICRKCGRVSDVRLDSDIEVMSHLVSASGYRVEDVFIELSGLCPDCSKNNRT